MSHVHVDRRNRQRDPLFRSRRRYPRIRLATAVCYESDTANVVAEEGDATLRGFFVPSLYPDEVGARGKMRLDLGEGPMVVATVEVARHGSRDRPGMALRIVEMRDSDRYRLAAYLLRTGGLSVLPQLDRRFSTLARAPRPRPYLA